jgi:hypothetical protein
MVFFLAGAVLLIVIGFVAWRYFHHPELTVVQLKSEFTHSNIVALDAKGQPIPSQSGILIPGGAISAVRLEWSFPLPAGEESAKVSEIFASLRNEGKVDTRLQVTVRKDISRRELRLDTPALSPSTGKFVPGPWSVALTYGPGAEEIGAKDFVVAPSAKPPTPPPESVNERTKPPAKRSAPLAPSGNW